MSEQCYRCERPAAGYVNVTASAASSITVVVRPCCDDHQPYRGQSQSQAPSPGTGDEATRAAAERLLNEVKLHRADYTEGSDLPDIANDIEAVCRAVLAGDRAAETRQAGEVSTLRAALVGLKRAIEHAVEGKSVPDLGAALKSASDALTEHEGAEELR